MSALYDSKAKESEVAIHCGKRAAALRVAILGGKGGVGKTNLAVNLAVAAGHMGARVLLVDGDLGLANVDVLLGLNPAVGAAEVLDGDCELASAVCTGPAGVHILAAASARVDLASAEPDELMRLLGPLSRCSRDYDLVLVDVAGGIASGTLAMAAVCEAALLVTTPEPTSLADAYATWKALQQGLPELAVELVVNDVESAAEADAVHRRLDDIGRRFLGCGIAMRRFLFRDRRLREAVSCQRAVVEAYPKARVSRQLVGLAGELLAERRSALPSAREGSAWRRVSQ